MRGNELTVMKRILIVDDTSENLRNAEYILRDKYLISLTKSGEQAFELIKRVKVDLILLDILMPDMDGYEVMEKLTQNPSTASIPVIFITGDTDKTSEAKCLGMGAVDYIKKPFIPDALLGRVQKALEFEDMRINLKKDANCDPMTNLWNRRYLKEYIEDAGLSGSSGAFLMMDIDNFKSINDSFGHDIGDRALMCFADTLHDYAGKNMCAGRLGGDEFVLFFKGEYSVDVIAEECRNLIAALEIKLNNLSSQFSSDDIFLGNNMSVSIGIAMMPQDGNAFDVLYKNADKSLYYIKQNGKRGYHFYQKDCNAAESDELQRNQIDIIHLKMMIEEKNNDKGAYKVGYDGFQKIYRFVSRCVERSGQPVQIMLFTLTSKRNDRDILDIAVKDLASAATKSLRRGDVVAKYGDYQYVVILNGTTTENGKIAAERTVSRWNKIHVNDDDISITYEIQSIEKKNGGKK